MEIKKISVVLLLLTFVIFTVFSCLFQGCAAGDSKKEIASGQNESPEPSSSDDASLQEDASSGDSSSSEKKVSDLEINLSRFALNFNRSMNIISSETSKSASSLGSFSSALAGEIKYAIFISGGYENPPEPFFDDIPSDGFINTPTGGECPLGASVMMSFTNAGGKEINKKYLDELNAKVIPYEIISLPESDPDSISSYLESQIKPGNLGLADPSWWNTEIWGTEGNGGLRSLQQDVKNIINYQLWSKSPEYESSIISEMEKQLSIIGIDRVTSAFNDSDKAGWVGYPAASGDDQIAQKNIMAEFSGNVEGTVYETGAFSIDAYGNTSFGTMTGEGQLLLKETKIGEVMFNTELQWSKINEKGAPVEGTVILTNEEKGYSIEITTNSDGTKNGRFLVQGKEVGKVSVDIAGHSTYINIESNSTVSIE